MYTMLKLKYGISCDDVRLLRKGGCETYAVCAGGRKYFLKVAGSAFGDTIRRSVDVSVYLRERSFNLPRVFPTVDGSYYAEYGDKTAVLYEFLDISEIDITADALEAGELVGALHAAMDGYGGALVERGRQFFVGRYIDILKAKNYGKADAFAEYGNLLWERVRNLPRGYSHGDLYDGNIGRAADGRLYLFDLDTSCAGFPVYDIALLCNRTDYFNFDKKGFEKTKPVLERVLTGYTKHRSISDREVDSVHDMLALYHFALQATIIEIYGINCVGDAFFYKQLDWLTRWEAEER